MRTVRQTAQAYARGSMCAKQIGKELADAYETGYRGSLTDALIEMESLEGVIESEGLPGRIEQEKLSVLGRCVKILEVLNKG